MTEVTGSGSAHDRAFNEAALRIAWQRIVGEVSRVGELLHAFLLDTLIPQGTEPAKTVARALLVVNHYYLCLHIVKARFDAAARDRLAQTRSQRPEDPETPELRVETSLSVQRCVLEIETFYLLAKLMLERIATTVALYFHWKLQRKGSNHRQLTKRFKALCSRVTGRKAPGRLHELMRKLDGQIVDFRNVHIEHVSQADLERGWLGMFWVSEGDRLESAHVVTRMRTGELVFTEDPSFILNTLIDPYVIEVLAFMQDNIEKSVAA